MFFSFFLSNRGRGNKENIQKGVLHVSTDADANAESKIFWTNHAFNQLLLGNLHLIQGFLQLVGS